jgi:hypothetical protein
MRVKSKYNDIVDFIDDAMTPEWVVDVELPYKLHYAFCNITAKDRLEIEKVRNKSEKNWNIYGIQLSWGDKDNSLGIRFSYSMLNLIDDQLTASNITNVQEALAFYTIACKYRELLEQKLENQ